MKASGRGPWLPDNVNVKPEEGVGRGGCRVQTAAGDIDATVNAQLENLKAMLWET
jgi:flagellar biosynthesis/type III secretory pathway protein FliH